MYYNQNLKQRSENVKVKKKKKKKKRDWICIMRDEGPIRETWKALNRKLGEGKLQNPQAPKKHWIKFPSHNL